MRSSALAQDLIESAGSDAGARPPAGRDIDSIDLLRSHEYDLLAHLLGRAPTPAILDAMAMLKGDASPLGVAHIALAEAALRADADALSREFFDLFIGIGRGKLLPYASYYLTGFLNGRPLARVRGDFAALGIERADELREPEDHVAVLLETMAGFASGRFGVDAAAERRFFERHLQPWAARFFFDLENEASGDFYRAVGAIGRLFVEIEAEAFTMDA